MIFSNELCAGLWSHGETKFPVDAQQEKNQRSHQEEVL